MHTSSKGDVSLLAALEAFRNLPGVSHSDLGWVVDGAALTPSWRKLRMRLGVLQLVKLIAGVIARAAGAAEQLCVSLGPGSSSSESSGM